MTPSTLAARDATWAERSATFTVFLCLGISAGAWAAALPGIKAGLALSDRDLSLALLGVAVGTVTSTLAAGAFVPRIGTGRATALAALCMAAALLFPAFAPSLGVLIGCGFLLGLSSGFTDVSMNGHASEIERRWGTAIMSSFHGAYSLGGLIGASLGGLMATAGLGTAGQLGVPVVLIVILVIGAAIGLGPGSRSEGEGIAVAWPERAVLGLCVIALCCMLIEGAIADWSAVYLATVVHVSEGAAAGGYAAFSVAMTIGRLTGDQIVRKLGTRVIIVGGGAIAIVGLALAVAAPSSLLAMAGFGLVGLGLANVAPTVFSAASRFGATPAAGIAMVVGVGYSGFILGPPLIGAVATVSSLTTGLAFLTVIGLGVVVSGLSTRLTTSS